MKKYNTLMSVCHANNVQKNIEIILKIGFLFFMQI